VIAKSRDVFSRRFQYNGDDTALSQQRQHHRAAATAAVATEVQRQQEADSISARQSKRPCRRNTPALSGGMQCRRRD
jgi:hypothetical protein